MSEIHYSIALDGPAGAGKSTVAKAIAEKLSWVYVDTGAMYRALALYFIEKELAPEDEAGISEAAAGAEVSINYPDGTQHVLLNGEDVTGKLREETVSAMASKSSQYAAVRARLLSLQRELARTADVIMDGRDIGTVVLPEATLKVFLTASPRIRAKRRYEQLRQQGKLQGATLSEIEAEIRDRDHRDSNRENAPLRQAEDAILLDSTSLTEEEVVLRIVEALSRKTGKQF